KASRSPVNDFGNQSQRLKRARSEILEQQKLSEIAETAFVGHRQHGSEALQVDILGADFMMGGHAEVSRSVYRLIRMIVSDVEHGGLRGACSGINEIHDRALVLSDYSGVRLGDEVAHRRRVPMVAASQAAMIIQSLLNNSPLALGRQDEVVKVNLE